MKEKQNKILPLIFTSLCLIGFLVLLVLVCAKFNFKIDKLGRLMANNRTSFLTNFFKIFTYLGSVYFFGFMVLLLLIFVKNKRIGICAGLNLAVSALAVVLVKYTVRRSRPIYMAIEEIGYSFPSAHSLLSLAFFGLMVYFVIKYLKNKPIKILLTITLVFVITMLGISRVYLGVHYLSDVLAGFLLGGAILSVNILLYPWFSNFKAKKQIK